MSLLNISDDNRRSEAIVRSAVPEIILSSGRLGAHLVQNLMVLRPLECDQLTILAVMASSVLDGDHS